MGSKFAQNLGWKKSVGLFKLILHKYMHIHVSIYISTKDDNSRYLSYAQISSGIEHIITSHRQFKAKNKSNSITINSRMSNRNIHNFHKYFKIFSLNEVHKKENSIDDIHYLQKGCLQQVVRLAQSAGRSSQVATHGELHPTSWSLHPWSIILESYIVLYI